MVGNWKLNPATAATAKELFVGVRNGVKGVRQDVVVVAAPPFPFIGELSKLSPSGRVLLGAQDVFYENGGPHTGEVAPTMLLSLGVTHTIIGHSERRAAGEVDEVVAKKTVAALKAKLTPIVCIGERKRDAHGDFYMTVAKQLRASLKGVEKKEASKLVIAYEPVWAISKGDGNGKVATPQDVEEMRLFITKELSRLYGRPIAARIPVLYGGSVNPRNVEQLWSQGDVDGFLVGGASLRAADFVTIVKAVI